MNKNYYISSDKNQLQLENIKHLFSQSYWANTRPISIIKKSIENSLCYGVFTNTGTQIGFARVITDYSTTFYLCDVIIDRHHRGLGLGSSLIESIVNDSRFENLHGILATSDAHGLYSKFGFKKNNDIFMNKPRK